jgi:uncharacterized protein (TIGR03790 family)
MLAMLPRLVVVFWAAVLGTASLAWGELRPEEVGVVAMAESRESREVAEYYVAARGIREANVFLLPGQPGESVSRAVWEQEMRPAIGGWLAGEGRGAKIRCLVTCWDVPLKIGKLAPDSPVIVTRKAYLADARQRYLARFAEAIQSFQSLAAGDGPGNPPAYAPDAPLAAIAEDFNRAAAAFQKRVEAAASDDEKKQAFVAFDKIVRTAGGASALVNLVAKQAGGGVGRPVPRAPAEVLQRIEWEKGRLEGLQRGVSALAALPDSVTRDVQILSLLDESTGIVGAIEWIDQQQELLNKNETHASFDSELSLLAWPDYPLYRWIENFSHYAFDRLPGKWPTLMVSRLAAPRVELVKKLIDTSIAVEESGLTGKVYLDARGLAYRPDSATPDGYSRYDQSIRDLAERLRQHTKLEVVLDNQKELFQPGQCPDAALYCGWYSLGKYVDAFDWRPGAVGYHIASSEATQLRKPGSRVWCNAMLEDGISATLGPVAEPYLAAFPLPEDFFSLLLTGRYTLAETFYRTKPFNSWQMVLVGDPLYNPFKNHPALDLEDLPERMKSD